MQSPWRSCIFAKSQTLDMKNLFDASAACPKVKSPQVFRLRKKAAEERSEIQQLVYDVVHYTVRRQARNQNLRINFAEQSM